MDSLLTKLMLYYSSLTLNPYGAPQLIKQNQTSKSSLVLPSKFFENILISNFHTPQFGSDQNLKVHYQIYQQFKILNLKSPNFLESCISIPILKSPNFLQLWSSCKCSPQLLKFNLQIDNTVWQPIGTKTNLLHDPLAFS